MIRHVAVIVPAADEEDRIGACLQSLEIARRNLAEIGGGVTTEVVVVLDRCRDRTADIVAGFTTARAVVSTARCVGAARGLGTAAALARAGAAGHSLDEVWTAHTDADSQVPTDWLQHMVQAAGAGADLVLGTVTPSLELPLPTRQAWQRFHLLADGHPHIHGANLGIRGSTLDRLDGWRVLRTGEDVDLVARVVATGACVHRTGAIPVRTSARGDGRAPEGFSSYLRALAV